MSLNIIKEYYKWNNFITLSAQATASTGCFGRRTECHKASSHFCSEH